MATGILGLGSSGSNGLSQELIDKLKVAESKAMIDPKTKDLETWDTEFEKISEIQVKAKELLQKISYFDLNSDTANAFQQVNANTTGNSVVFNAVDAIGLEPGNYNVDVLQLAQKDVYQTSVFTNKDEQIFGGNDEGDSISITVGDDKFTFSTEGKSYKKLVDEINLKDTIKASVEQVGDAEFRLVIKSKDSGEANKLKIETTGLNMGFGNVTSSVISDFSSVMGAGRLQINGNMVIPDTEFMNYDQLISEITKYGGGNVYTATKVGDTIEIKANNGSAINIVEDGDNGLNFQDTSHVVTAQNMKANIDGVAYNVSSNSITIQGTLSMTAIDLGTSSITIEAENSYIQTGLNEFVTVYNELVDLVDNELYSSETALNDLGSIRLMMSGIKSHLFDNYGENDDKSIFNYGFSIDKTGHISIDSKDFSTAITNDINGLKTLFIGTFDNKGLGTKLKEYVDNLDGFDGLLTKYSENMDKRKIKLEEEKTKAQTALDTKYYLMSQQFASYTAMITQMEAAFGGMKMMIEQSTVSK